MNTTQRRRPARYQTCPTCGEAFKAYVSQQRKFCSLPCRHEAERAAKVDVKFRKGYRVLYVGRGHPMADGGGNAYEHRIVLSEHLGRPLARDEHVHHVNEVRTDNRIENLELTNASAHMALHRRVDGWSTTHAACVACGTVERKHAGQGRGTSCYQKAWRA